ncbi:DUF1611 domain-containing protein [Halovenus sp. WSH3]|uniref:DUF1611 domain-containing protein n=1 Tax=Halovenus carboxidivorans TaxID=2692199 RepID=A0A6B0TAV0_9EURY|nr:DUF1611 domain-containing protein [Halovenus carboxidivorans]MXR52743.1 DUF1611 domain-containing protein [Halovenus carboxidivorans]
MRVAILAHEQFPDDAKTAVGVLRYSDHDAVAVLDRERAGQRVRDHLPDVQDAPIVAEMDDAPECDALLIGIAPIGGGFEESWRPDVAAALRRGCDVVAGLHYLLGEDEQFRALAEEHAGEIRDVRRPPEDLTVASGTAGDVDARVVLTVGTDCSSGKMTGAYELRAAARERGLDAAVVPTGQTGIMISGRGIAIDRVISDFAAGATERLVTAAADHDVLFVEGQGALAHPAYSGVTTAILHGAQPDSLVLCHVAGRQRVGGYERFELPDPGSYAQLYESMAAPVSGATVDAGFLNTAALDRDEADQRLDAYEQALDAPVTDPVRDGAAAVLDAVL